MGDADPRANVRVTDDLDTIDGDQPRSEAPPSAPLPAGQPARDHLEFAVVDPSLYTIKGEIGRGGIGRVLEARDLRLGRNVAIKELLPQNRDAQRRFEREARITARLQHPAIIHIYEAGRWKGGEPFYAMPHVEGESLDKVVAKLPTLAERLGLLPHVIAVADALAYAHNENVIHRDLKPHNVLVGSFGETVVIDWGLAMDLDKFDAAQSLVKPRARPDETSGVIGTPAYMSPEQARGERDRIDQRSDVYSLGALLYHVLVGKAPYSDKRGTAKDVIELVIAGPCTSITEREPNTPPDLVAIVDKAMAREQADRYANAEELAHDLKKFQNGQLVAARRYSRRELITRWLRRNAVVVGISTAALVAVGIIGGVSISRILHEKNDNQRRRNTLLEERGRSELLDGQAGRAIAYLHEAERSGEPSAARRHLIADAIRPFDAQLASFQATTAAFASNGDVVALELTGIEVHSPAGSTRHLGDPTVSRNRLLISGNRVITVDGDHVIRVWSNGRPRELRGHRATIRDAHVSADGRLLVTGSDDGDVFVWDLETDKRVEVALECNQVARASETRQDLDLPRHPAVAVRLAPDGDYGVVATDDNTVCLFDARTGFSVGKADREEEHPLRGHKARIRTIRWNPDPKRKLLLTASDDGTALVWDPFKGKPVMAALVHDGRAIRSAEWSSDGRTVVTAGADHVARLWKIPDDIPEDDPTLKAKELRRFVGHAAALDAAVFDATDTRIATAGDDYKAKVWDVASGELVATFEHADVVSTIAFAPAGDRLLTASNDGATRLWDLAHGVVRTPYELDARIFAVAVAAGGAVAAATADSHVTIWRGSAEPVTLREHDGRVFALAFSPDGRQLASAGEDEAAIVWEHDTAVARLGGHKGATNAIAFSPDGTELATAGDEGTVRRWISSDRRWSTATPLASLEHGSKLVELAYSPDGLLLVGLDEDGQLVVWSRATGVPASYVNLTTGKTRAFAFSSDGQRLVVGGTDTKIYRVANGKLDPDNLIRVGPTGQVHTVAFTRDDACVITAGVDGIVQLWDASKGKLLGTRGTRGGAVDSLAVTVDGTTVWAGGADQLVRGWDIHAETRTVDELAKIVDRAPWQLDDDDVVGLKTGGMTDEQR